MTDPKDRDDLIAFYRRCREEQPDDDRNRWIYLIKELRITYGCSIYEAEQRALSDPVWRRWVERQINTDQRCAKLARRHIRHNGATALLSEQHGRLVVL